MFIAPSTEAQGFIGVQNGWDNTRVIFMMEIEEINLGQSCVIMGYADKLDLSHGGLLDPELKLFINSTITLQRVQATTPNGIVYRKHIADNSHLLGVNNVQALNVYSQPSPYGMPNNTGGVEKIYLQRPMDITTNLSTTFMSSSQLLSDGRTMLFPGRQANSKRMNNSAPSYLSEVINGIREGFADDAVMNRSSESMEIYNTVTDSIEESNPTGNHIMRYITHNSNLAVQGFVTWGQMCRMFPDLDPKTDLFFMDNLPTQISGAHFESAAGRYEDWAVAQLTFAMRIFDHDVDISYSTRESAEIRNHMATLGVTTMSAESKTEPGGYYSYPQTLEQFHVSDERKAVEVERDLKKLGREPVWKDWDQSFDFKR
jgi:hypothetical protein